MNRIFFFLAAIFFFSCQSEPIPAVANLGMVQESDAFKKSLEVNDQILDLLFSRTIDSEGLNNLMKIQEEQGSDISLCQLDEDLIKEVDGGKQYIELMCESLRLLGVLNQQFDLNNQPELYRNVLKAIGQSQDVESRLPINNDF